MQRQADGVTVQVHEIYIRATPQAVWEAITSPEWTTKYGYRSAQRYDLRAGGEYRCEATPQMLSIGLPEIVIDGQVLESHPPSRLVQTFRFLFNEANAAEGFTRLTWEIEPQHDGFTRLTITHDVSGAPLMASATASKYSRPGGGGWAWILSDLKSLLETGAPMVP